jgi:hypothetical protein
MTWTVAVGAVKGPGAVSTVTLTMAATAAVSGPVMMVEADPSGGSMLARCPGLAVGADLHDLALSRNGSRLVDVAQRLGDVAVVPAWGRPFRLSQALMRPRVPWPMRFGEFDGTVFVDVGRVWPEAPTMGLLASADVVVLVAASEPGPVAATLEWAGRGGRHGGADTGVGADRVRMVTCEVVGRRRGVSVTPKDLGALTGVGWLGHLHHDEVAVEWLWRGASVTDRALRHRPFIEAARGVVGGLFEPMLTGAVAL